MPTPQAGADGTQRSPGNTAPHRHTPRSETTRMLFKTSTQLNGRIAVSCARLHTTPARFLRTHGKRPGGLCRCAAAARRCVAHTLGGRAYPLHPLAATHLQQYTDPQRHHAPTPPDTSPSPNMPNGTVARHQQQPVGADRMACLGQSGHRQLTTNQTTEPTGPQQLLQATALAGVAAAGGRPGAPATDNWHPVAKGRGRMAPTRR